MPVDKKLLEAPEVTGGPEERVAALRARARGVEAPKSGARSASRKKARERSSRRMFLLFGAVLAVGAIVWNSYSDYVWLQKNEELARGTRRPKSDVGLTPPTDSIRKGSGDTNLSSNRPIR